MSHCRARRKYGACYGTLWKQHSVTPGAHPSSLVSFQKDSGSDKASIDVLAAAIDKNERGKVFEFCVLVGNTLTCYDNLTTFRRGDHPSSEVRIVGASAWNPPPAKAPKNRRALSNPIHSPQTSPTSNGSSSSSHGSSSSSSSPTFRLLTHAGTHIYCSAQTVADRDIWLSALHSGLEISYAGYEDTLTALRSLTPDGNGNGGSAGGKVDLMSEEDLSSIASLPSSPRPPKSLSPTNNDSNSNGKDSSNILIDGNPLEPTMLTPPIPQRAKKKNLLQRRNSSQSQTSTSQLSTMSYSTPIPTTSLSDHGAAFLNPYDNPNNGPLSKTHCISCGRFPPESAMRIGGYSNVTGTPLAQYGLEQRVQNVCHSCLISQGVLRHVNSLTGLYACDAHERVALMKGKDMAIMTVERVMKNERGKGMDGILGDDLGQGEEEQNQRQGMGLEDVVMTPDMVTAVMDMIGSAGFSACRRRSSALDHISSRLEHGIMGAAEFLEELNEYAQDAIASSTLQAEAIKMKKEALMVSGDMRAAIKMLHENALPKSSGNGMGAASSRNTEMLSCILEFFLDLCDEGELSSIAFFWPQLCQIHMQMLPATDSESLARIELVEDFFLTICSRYSIHLALETVWSCIADLEESIGSSTASASCRRRRFALLRFICELESLIFDRDGGWGGGTVSLRGMFMPSDHQSVLIRNAMGILQMHRRFSSLHLTRSTRLEKLKGEAEIEEKSGEHKTEPLSDEGAISAAERKYRIARNAEYFSTQLMFARRLGDIAEKLRFMEVEDRSATLQNDLDILNSSGRLGGDPLNIINGSGQDFVNVMKIPKSEGHVFRSKERTPVLLLMEILRDENLLETSPRKLKSDSDSPSNEAKSNQRSLVVQESESGTDGYESPDECAGKGSNQEDVDLLGIKMEINDISCLQTPKSSQKKQGVLKSPLSYESESSVGNLVANMVQEKLKVTIPDLGEGPSQSYQSCQSDSQSKNSNDDSNVAGSESGSKLEDGKVAPEETNILNTTTPLQPIEQALIEDDAQYSSVTFEDAEKESKTPDEDKTADTCETDINGESTPGKDSALQCSLDDDETPEPGFIRKVSAFGALKRSFNNRSGQSNLNPANLTVHGEGRRQVLTAIFTKGMRSSNNIARGVAPAARRAVQAMDRKRAQTLINSKAEDGEKILNEGHNFSDEGWKIRESMNGNSDGDRDFMAKESEEEECIEAIRLLLVQNSVALGKLTPESAVKALGAKNKLPYPDDSGQLKSDEEFDAGKIDSRLAGCGTLSEAVWSALQLWKEGYVSNAELLDLVHKDVQFNRLALPGAENESKLKEDSAFWGRFAFGERWAEKKARIQASSVFGSLKGWDLTGLIVKSNDDLRQEAFAMQLITLAAEAFDIAGLELWIKPYRILATGRTTGMIELVCNGMSFDSLKKRPGYSEGGLLGHFKKMSECAADPSEALKTSKKNFVRSLAAYSLLSYLFLFKDRHNGNLLLDTAGHVIHIDFGFIFGIAPGGSFSLEQSVPFKLTEEMIEVMDGLGSVLFSEFVTLFCCGFLALQTHCETFVNIVEITCQGSTFNCFQGKDQKEIISNLRERFCPELSKEETISHAMELIRQACNANGTKQYDFFQYMSQGIAA